MRLSHEAIYTYLYVLPSGTFKRELVAISAAGTAFVARARCGCHLGPLRT